MTVRFFEIEVVRNNMVTVKLLARIKQHFGSPRPFVLSLRVLAFFLGKSFSFPIVSLFFFHGWRRPILIIELSE